MQVYKGTMLYEAILVDIIYKKYPMVIFKPDGEEKAA